jgi:hypothetical protein
MTVPTWLRERRDVLAVAGALPVVTMIAAGVSGLPSVAGLPISSVGFWIGAAGSGAVLARVRMGVAAERLAAWREDPELVLDDVDGGRR